MNILQQQSALPLSPTSPKSPTFSIQKYQSNLNKISIIEQLSLMQINQQQQIKMKNQLQIFYDCFVMAPTMWMDLLDKDGIQSQTEIIVINRPSTLSKIYYKIMKQINKKIQENNRKKMQEKIQNGEMEKQNIKQENSIEIQQKQKCISFQQQYIDQTSLLLIAEILNNYAKSIALCFQYGKSSITKQAQKIDQQIKKSQIMNTYMLFAMLKQMASMTQDIIMQDLRKVFPKIQQKKRKQFCKYIQKNYQFGDLHCKVTLETKILSKKQLQDDKKEQNQKWFKYLKDCQNKNDIKLKRIQSAQGNKGILLLKKQQNKDKNNTQQSTKTDKNTKQKKDIKKQQKSKSKSPHSHSHSTSCSHQNQHQNQYQIKHQNSPKQNPSHKKKQQQSTYTPQLIFRIQNNSQIRITNARICQQSWRIFNTQDSIQQLYDMLLKQIQIQNKDKDKDYYSYAVPTCQGATIGGSLGRCLADINQYQNANQFLLDLSKTTAIFSTLSYAIAQIPILSYFIVAGGFTYSFYLACSNKVTSQSKKINQVGLATMIAVGSVGSTLGGILLGQAIIPVPFLGAFIGGVVGGFFGTKGVRKINKFLYKSNFRDIILYLKGKIIMKRYWKYNKYLLQRIGINQKYFNQHTPQSQSQKDLYITAICFCIVTFYQSKRYVQRNQRKMLQCKKANKIIEQTQDQQTFQNQFNIVNIIDFLTQGKFMILEQIQQLQNFIIHLSG